MRFEVKIIEDSVSPAGKRLTTITATYPTVDAATDELVLKCRDMAKVLFLSCEPLVGPLDLEYPESLFPKGPPMCCSGFECCCRGLPCEPSVYLYEGIDWIITGGESGPEARPNHPDWFRSLRDQAARNHIPFHFKQWGEWGPESTATPAQINNAAYEVCDRGERLYRVGKVAAGRMLDGVEHDAFPEANDGH